MIIKPKYYGPSIPSTYAVALTAAASGSNGITVADDDDIDFGTGDFFLHWEGSLPDWTPNAVSRVIHKRQTNSIRWAFAVNTDGTLSVFAADGGGTILSITSASAASITASAIAKITAVVTRESALVAGSVAFYVNGIALGASVAITAATPTTINNTGALSICAANTAADGRIESNTISCIVGNFAPTAAEVATLCTTGIPESWKWGSQATALSANFSAGLDGWTSTNNTNSFGVTKDGRTNCMESTCSSTTSPRWQKPIADLGLTGKKKIQVTIPIYIDPTSSGNRVDVSLAIGTSAGATIVSTVAITGIPKGQWNDYTVQLDNSAGTATVVRVQRGAGVAVSDLWWLSSIGTLATGATFAALPETIPTSGALAWTDSSGNTAGGTLPAAGATKVTIRK